MLRAGIAAIAVLAVLPVSEAAARTRIDTVKSYYRALDREQHGRAWVLLSNATKEQLGPFSKFRAGYRSTYLVELDTVQIAGRNVGVKGRSCDNAPGGAIATRFEGSWATVGPSGRYKLARPRIQVVSRTRVPECE